MKRSASASDKAHMARVAALGCVLCEFLGYHDSPCEIHHVRVNHGWGRSSHKATIGLCAEHHRGITGVHSHGREEFAALHGISELELLARVNEQMGIE